MTDFPVTIRIKRGQQRDVYAWCFEHLSRPAHLYSFEIYQGSRVLNCPQIWRRLTKRLHNASCGTYRSDRAFGNTVPDCLYMTLVFRDQSDATLFAIHWGSVPWEKNRDMHMLVGAKDWTDDIRRKAMLTYGSADNL